MLSYKTREEQLRMSSRMSFRIPPAESTDTSSSSTAAPTQAQPERIASSQKISINDTDKSTQQNLAVTQDKATQQLSGSLNPVPTEPQPKQQGSCTSATSSTNFVEHAPEHSQPAALISQHPATEKAPAPSAAPFVPHILLIVPKTSKQSQEPEPKGVQATSSMNSTASKPETHNVDAELKTVPSNTQKPPVVVVSKDSQQEVPSNLGQATISEKQCEIRDKPKPREAPVSCENKCLLSEQRETNNLIEHPKRDTVLFVPSTASNGAVLEEKQPKPATQDEVRVTLPQQEKVDTSQPQEEKKPEPATPARTSISSPKQEKVEIKCFPQEEKKPEPKALAEIRIASPKQEKVETYREENKPESTAQDEVKIALPKQEQVEIFRSPQEEKKPEPAAPTEISVASPKQQKVEIYRSPQGAEPIAQNDIKIAPPKQEKVEEKKPEPTAQDEVKLASPKQEKVVTSPAPSTPKAKFREAGYRVVDNNHKNELADVLANRNKRQGVDDTKPAR